MLGVSLRKSTNDRRGFRSSRSAACLGLPPGFLQFFLFVHFVPAFCFVRARTCRQSFQYSVSVWSHGP